MYMHSEDKWRIFIWDTHCIWKDQKTEKHPNFINVKYNERIFNQKEIMWSYKNQWHNLITKRLTVPWKGTRSWLGPKQQKKFWRSKEQRKTENLSTSFDIAIYWASEIIHTRMSFIQSGHHSKATRKVK